MGKTPQVRDIMSPVSYALPPDASAFKALDILVERKIAGIPIVDEDMRLVGFLSEKDCLRLQSTSHQYNVTGIKVRDMMSSIKESLSPEMDLLSAAMRFLSCNFSAMPVLDGETLVGTVTRFAMVETIQKVHWERGKTIKLDKEKLALFKNPSSIEALQAVVGASSKAQLASVLGGRHTDTQ